jgi:threonine/homoserine/homoserine lactone efflux protein
MLDTSHLSLFIVAAVAMLLTPGPAVMYIVTRSIDQGRRAGLASVLGIQTGTLFHVAAAALGLSAILVSSALAFNVVKLLGAAYLIYLGLRKLLSREQAQETRVVERASLRRIYSQGVIVNILNPKTALFFFAFLPQFADASRGSVPAQMLLLGCIFTGLALLTDGTYAMLAGTAGNWLKSNPYFLRAERYLAGSIYVGLGLVTALSGTNNKD